MSTGPAVLHSPSTSTGRSARAARPDRPLTPLLSRVSRLWWVELGLGLLWLAIAAVVLRFDHASVVTVGVLTGLMFLMVAAEQMAIAVVDRVGRPLWILFGLLLGAGGIVALIDPVSTFAGMADIVGAVFFVVGVMWIVQAFAERAVNELWGLTLTSGILMIGLGFWVSGEFFLDRAYTLLVFAGAWAAAKGVTDIVRALQIRRLTGLAGEVMTDAR